MSPSTLHPTTLSARTANVVRFATSELRRRPIPTVIALVAAWAAGSNLWLVGGLGAALYEREAARLEAALPTEVILVPPPGAAADLRIDTARLAELLHLPGVRAGYPLIESQVELAAPGRPARLVPTRGRTASDPGHGTSRLVAGRGFAEPRAREVVVSVDLFERLGGRWTDAGPSPATLEARVTRRLAGTPQAETLALSVVGLVRDAKEAELVELPIGLAIDLDAWFDGRDVEGLPAAPGGAPRAGELVALDVEFGADAGVRAREELARCGLVVEEEVVAVLEHPTGRRPRPVPAPSLAGRRVRVVAADGAAIPHDARVKLELARPTVRRVSPVVAAASTPVASPELAWVRGVLFADDPASVAPLVGRLRRDYGYQTIDRLADQRALRELGRSLALLVGLLVGGCLVVAAVSVVGTNAQKIQARVFEIGLLRANAVPVRRVLAIHVVQGALLGGLAFVAAGAVRLVVAPAAATWLSRTFGAEGGPGLELAGGTPWIAAAAAAICLAGTVAGTTLPAWWTCLRLSPLEALRRRA